MAYKLFSYSEMYPYSKCTIIIVFISWDLFHYSLSIEHLHDLPLSDIFTTACPSAASHLQFKCKLGCRMLHNNKNTMTNFYIVCFPLIPRATEVHAARLRSPQRARSRYPNATVSWGRANAVVPKRRKNLTDRAW